MLRQQLTPPELRVRDATRQPRRRPWPGPAIVAALVAWNDLHGRPPSTVEWRVTTQRHPSARIVELRFGSWSKGLIAAGLPAPRSATSVRWTEEAITRALRDWARAHGRTPRPSDWPSAGDGHPPRMLVNRRFGRWEDALSAAGLEPSPLPVRGRWSRQAIIDVLRDWANTHGGPPRSTQWNSGAPGRPTRYMVLKRFGSWDAALRAAGLR